MKKNAVSINGVTKKFRLPQNKHDSLKSKVLSMINRTAKGKDHNIHHALRGVDLSIKKGEFIGILGRNGAGKSTLLKIIARIYQPTTGKVIVNGRLVPFIELGVGFNKNLSGRDNIYLNGAMLGFSRDEIDNMYDSIVDFSELHGFMDQKLINYSSGMKVRLAFSIAIKANADILLLDEVIAVGDAAFRRKCYDYFDTLKKNKKTIIFVTHNMSAVRNYCDRAVLLEGGKIAFDGTPEEATDHYFQLFNTKKEAKSKNKEIIINHLEVDMTGDKLLFKVNIKNQSEKDITDVIIRIAVKKQNGRVVAGFDNKNIEEPYEIDLKSSEEKELYFESINILGNGNYVVNCSLTSPQKADFIDEEDEESTQSNIFDSRPGIAHFTVTNSGTGAPVILPTTKKIEENEK